MPLIACPVCEKLISKKAITCPNCGEPDPFNRQAISKMVTSIIWIALLAGAVYAFWVYGMPYITDFIRNL